LEARDDEISISLIDIFRFVVSKWLTIALCVALTVGMALLYIARTEPTFTAEAELLIDARSSQFLREQLGEVGLNLDAGQIESQIAVLRSEQIALVVINKLNLLEDPEFAGPQPAGAKGEATKTLTDRQRLRQIISGFQSGLDIRRKGVSYVIEVSYSADTPERAALFANAAADAFIEDQLAARAQAAKQGSLWLEERIEEIRNQMNRANLKVQEFRSRRDYRIRSSRGSDADKAATEEKHVEAEGPLGTLTTLEELESTALTYRKMYESFLQAYTESVQRQSYPGTNARVISRATPPLTKSAPRTKRILAAAFVAGILLGLAIGLLQLIWRFGATLDDRRQTQSFT
jgi:uncharacterized protein involved in exopolysaccharide biosynthesis